MLSGGNEYLFWIDSLPCDEKNRIDLTYIENDSHGMKLTGGIPFLWDYVNNYVVGPNLYDDDHTYRVIDVDYRNNHIWLEEI